VFQTDLFSSWPDAFVVSFSGHPLSRTLFGDPTSGRFFVQKIEPQTPDVHGLPFSLVPGPDEVPATDLALPVKECAVVDGDLLLGPQMSG